MKQKALSLTAVAFALSFLCAGLAFAQETTVSGTVTDAQSGETLPGVNVTIQGTQSGTVTDAQGQYELGVPGPNATLVFSFVGYRSETVQVGDRTVIDVSLQQDVGQLDQVVVTGYGSQRRQEITGSVSSVDIDAANVGQTTSPQDLLRGRVSGVQVLDNSGEPGAGTSVRIRGTSSITAGAEPLYVIDGVPINSTNVTPGGASSGGVSSSSSSNPLALINPQDIESMQVLKDAAATAIYGSQGANGVVLIETKSGQGETLQVDYSGKVSAATFANQLDVANGTQFRRAESCASDLGDFDSFGQCFSQREGDFSGTSTDWQEEASRAAVQHEHNLSLSGGTEASSFRASLNYMSQEGILLENALDRLTGRVNARHQEFDNRLRFNLNLTASYLNRKHLFFNQGGGFEGGVIKGMVGFDPRQPVRSETGAFNEFSSSIKNPVALQERVLDRTDQKRIIGNFSAELDILENLTADATIGIDNSEGIRRTGIPGSGPTLWVGRQTEGLARQAERELSNIVPQLTLEYEQDLLGSHTLRLLGGAEYEREVWQAWDVQTEEFITDATLFNNLGGGANPQDPGSTKQLVEQIGLFGRLNYNINDRYLLNATLRRDGSSVFGANQKFAWFPSASVGWNIAQQSWLQDTEWLTQLKLRLSYGISGNQAVPPLRSQAILAPDPTFSGVFGDSESGQTGVAQRQAPNPDLKWEETEEFNVGLDFTAGRFDGSIEGYRKTTTDLLLEVPVPPPSVSTTRLGNVGEVRNTGVEASVSAFVIEREDMSLNVGLNASSNRNEVRSLGGREFIDHTPVNGAGQTGVDAQRLQAGHPIGAFYGPVFERINDAGNEVYRTPDGGTTTALGEAERAFLGNPVPDVTYGLNLSYQYQSFDVSAFFRGEQGREIFNNTGLEFATKSNLGRGIGILEEALQDGTNSGHVPNYSSRWIQDASFFRLDNLTLGYTLPDAGTYGLRRARIYGTVQNVFVITPYDGFDPEVNTNVTGRGLGFRDVARPTRGVDYTSYPRSRTFTLGLEVGF
jgi:iron complex outermembrane receptor protein